MPLYDVLKRIEFKETGEVKLPGETVELDLRRGDWLAKQHKAVRLRGSPISPEAPALLTPKPAPRKSTGCCGR